MIETIAIGILLVGAIMFGLMAFINGRNAADMTRYTEDKDAVMSYAKSVSLDALEKSIDTAWRKSNVSVISSPEIAEKARVYVTKQIEKMDTKFSGLEVVPGTIQIEIGNGTYTETAPGKYEQADDQRPYIKGTMKIRYTQAVNNEIDSVFTNSKFKKFKEQEIYWFIYAISIPSQSLAPNM